MTHLLHTVSFAYPRRDSTWYVVHDTVSYSKREMEQHYRSTQRNLQKFKINYLLNIIY